MRFGLPFLDYDDRPTAVAQPRDDVPCPFVGSPQARSANAQQGAAQRVRNPLEKIPGTLETDLALWIDTTTQRGQRDFWSAVHARWDGTRLWVLPSKPQLLGMVKGRGDKTVKRYLVADAGMAEALAGVPEFGPTGQLWTSTPAYCNFGELEGSQCRDAVSTNNAYVRAQPALQDSTEPRFYSFLVTPLNDKERDRYRFLLK